MSTENLTRRQVLRTLLPMRGILRAAGALPYWRLQRSAIGDFHGGRGKGTRTVASYDEDTTTLGVAAARLLGDIAPDTLWFTTSTPTYLEKNNASVIHAALQLPAACGAFDIGGALRSSAGALRNALEGNGTQLLVSADIRTGLPNSPDESAGGDAGAALLIGDSDDLVAEYLDLVAEYLGGASATREFLDRWRTPGDVRIKQWEEKHGETRYVALAQQAFADGLAAAGLAAGDVDQVVIATAHPRAGGVVGKKLGLPVADDLGVGRTGAAEPALLLTAAIEAAAPGTVIALVVLADGADVLFFRTTGTGTAAQRSIAAQINSGNDSLPYAKFLSWRGVMAPEPPRRPEPARMSGSAAGRSVDWKYGLVGSQDRDSGALHMPPARVSRVGGNVDDMEPAPMANATGKVVTYTVDRLAYSPSPPVIFAVVDFAGGGRLPVELTDTTPEEISVGTEVEMTFRRLNSADGIANYFWKARPRREEA
jgi:3-hydroxy-3-methylglutaryl CoA synthase/uncharacterized OB-fold protein